jgi:hypothetical protein
MEAKKDVNEWKRKMTSEYVNLINYQVVELDEACKEHIKLENANRILSGQLDSSVKAYKLLEEKSSNLEKGYRNQVNQNKTKLVQQKITTDNKCYHTKHELEKTIKTLRVEHKEKMCRASADYENLEREHAKKVKDLEREHAKKVKDLEAVNSFWLQSCKMPH